LFLTAALVVLAAGCGGGKKSTGPSNPGATGGTGATGTISATGARGPTGSGSSSFASASNCLQFAALGAKIASAMAPASSGGTQATFQAEARDLQAFADAAPSNVKADFQTFATAFSSYLQALHKAGYNIGSMKVPTAAQITALTNAAKMLDTAKMKTAEQHLRAWVQNNCN
jgi:hypothetical protein